MRIVIAKDYEDMSARAARIVAGQIYLKPNSVLGMATRVLLLRCIRI